MIYAYYTVHYTYLACIFVAKGKNELYERRSLSAAGLILSTCYETNNRLGKLELGPPVHWSKSGSESAIGQRLNSVLTVIVTVTLAL